MIPRFTSVDCVILGGGGHAAVVIDALKSSGSGGRLAVLDSDETKWGKELLDVPVLGGDSLLSRLAAGGVRFFVVGLGGAGDNVPRKRLFELGISCGLDPLRIVHPAAVCSGWAEIGSGSVLMAGSIVNARSFLGVNVIVNSGAVVEHDCRVEDHVHLATGSRLAANVRVGAGAHVGVGASVRQGVKIGEEAVIGAGSVVVRDVYPRSTVVGVPAKAMDRSNKAY